MVGKKGGEHKGKEITRTKWERRRREQGRGVGTNNTQKRRPRVRPEVGDLKRDREDELDRGKNYKSTIGKKG